MSDLLKIAITAVVSIALTIGALWALFLRRVPLSRAAPTPKTKRRIPDPARVREIVAERRARIRQALAEVGPTGVVQEEFVELPPQQEPFPRHRFGENRVAAAYHTAILNWQLADDRYVLLERVIDAMVSLQRQQPGATPPADLLFSARLCPTDWRQRNAPPPRVVIEAARPPQFEKYLDGLRDCLGVELQPLLETKPLGACTEGTGGSTGQLSGVLRDPGPNGTGYGLVCHHVLSDSCGSLEWPDPPNRPEHGQYGDDRPDAALVSLGNPCFCAKEMAEVPIVCAQSADVDRFSAAGLPVVKWPALGGRRGTIGGLLSAFPYNGRQVRGPHLFILAEFHRRVGITLPLLDTAFSKPGHSGAWVTDQDRTLWFGMVVQGAPAPSARTFALLASFLLDFLARARPSLANLKPFRLEGR